MKIALTTHGTRGDVQPFVSMALALMERGHDVTLGAPTNLVAFVEKCGVRAGKLALDSQAFLESPQGRAWLASGNVSTFMKQLAAITRQHRDELIEDYTRVCAEADVLVTGVLTEDYVSAIAEAKRLPLVTVHFNPFRSNSTYANGLVTTRSLPGFLNRFTHSLAESAWWSAYRDDVNVFRARLGLAATKQSTARRLTDAGALVLHAFSPTIAPAPQEYEQAMPVVGAIRFPTSARERLGEAKRDEDLARWLARGEPPVFFGLGSMPVQDPIAMLRMVAAVAKNLGVRALVGAGWSRLEGAEGVGEHVRIVGAVDHGWLFPQCAAAVHHGGAGTVFAALEAGLPAVLTSVFADQPFWGARLEALEAGVHLPFRKLNADRLESALRRVLEPGMRARAKTLGERLRAEPDAVPRIVERIEKITPALTSRGPDPAG